MASWLTAPPVAMVELELPGDTDGHQEPFRRAVQASKAIPDADD